MLSRLRVKYKTVRIKIDVQLKSLLCKSFKVIFIIFVTRPFKTGSDKHRDVQIFNRLIVAVRN